MVGIGISRPGCTIKDSPQYWLCLQLSAQQIKVKTRCVFYISPMEVLGLGGRGVGPGFPIAYNTGSVHPW